MSLTYRRVFIFCSLVLFACKPAAKLEKPYAIDKIRFMGQYILPNAVSFEGTVVGGLSGIDYDKKNDQYYLICDDPSAFSPARFYTMKIPVSERGIDTVIITGVTTVLNPYGKPYPDIRKDRIHSADLEAMRFDVSRNEFIRSSEGQRVMTDDTVLLQDPDIVIMDREGRYKDSFHLPSILRIRAEETGPRHNSVLEGLSLDATGRDLFVSMEDALYQDGPKAGTGDSTALIRIFKFDRKSRAEVAEYAYRLDPVPYPANPAGAFKINGVSDILYIGGNRLLVIERAWSTGRGPSNIRLYIADMTNASDVKGVASLQHSPEVKTIEKKLLLNLDDLGFFIYNVEGVTLGPTLPNGHGSLLLVVDDNFSKTEKNQFLLFEIVP